MADLAGTEVVVKAKNAHRPPARSEEERSIRTIRRRQRISFREHRNQKNVLEDQKRGPSDGIN